jgi:hypothetical protein
MNPKSTAVIVFVAALGMPARVSAQSKGEANDSLLQRLRNTGHVHIGLQKDQRLAGYVLYTFTASQHKENLASLSAHHEELDAYADRVDAAKEKLQAAEQLREHRQGNGRGGGRAGTGRVANASLRNEMFRNFHKVREDRPTSELGGSISLFNVVRYGSDYLELRGEESPDYLQVRRAHVAEGSVLIPLSRICKVVIGSSNPQSTTEDGEQQIDREDH